MSAPHRPRLASAKPLRFLGFSFSRYKTSCFLKVSAPPSPSTPHPRQARGPMPRTRQGHCCCLLPTLSGQALSGQDPEV